MTNEYQFVGNQNASVIKVIGFATNLLNAMELLLQCRSVVSLKILKAFPHKACLFVPQNYVTYCEEMPKLDAHIQQQSCVSLYGITF